MSRTIHLLHGASQNIIWEGMLHCSRNLPISYPQTQDSNKKKLPVTLCEYDTWLLVLYGPDTLLLVALYVSHTWLLDLYGSDTWLLVLYGSDTWLLVLYGPDTLLLDLYTSDTWLLV
jgi:hypothetical protein